MAMMFRQSDDKAAWTRVNIQLRNMVAGPIHASCDLHKLEDVAQRAFCDSVQHHRTPADCALDAVAAARVAHARG